MLFIANFVFGEGMNAVSTTYHAQLISTLAPRSPPFPRHKHDNVIVSIRLRT